MEEVMLSIYVPTYYHEKYIAQALDSILMQKTQYTYEVLIGDDASGDRTPEILRSYQKQYPSQFTVFYREYNMHGLLCNNGQDLLKRCKGKYIICLEGDDYWISEDKIEKQITFLENHPEYMAVAHNCVVVDENSQIKNETYPECKDEEYTFQHFASDILPGQMTTIMVRNYLKDPEFDSSLIFENLLPTDRFIAFSIISYGKIYCMQEKMSAYRHVIKEGKSFSATNTYNFERSQRWHALLLDYALKLGKKDSIKYAELVYLHALVEGSVYKEIAIWQIVQYMKNIPHKSRTLYFYVKRFINKNILHKTIWY